MMATRKDVRTAFYSELETATSSHLADDDITQEYPDEGEQLPKLVHNDAYRENPMNMGTAPKRVEDNNDGTYDAVFTKPMQARFSCVIVSESESTKESIYEDLRSYFEKFEFPKWDPSTIQTDVHNVSVGGSDSQDDQDREPASRGDNVTITLGYERFYHFTVDEIGQIDHLVDSNLDDIEDINYTTT